MDTHRLKRLLEEVKSGEMPVEQTLDSLLTSFQISI